MSTGAPASVSVGVDQQTIEPAPPADVSGITAPVSLSTEVTTSAETTSVSVAVEVEPAAAAPARKISLPILNGGGRPPPMEEEYLPPAEDVRDLIPAGTRPPQQIDAFGRDPDFERRAERVLEVLYKRYFRVSVRGIENVPEKGPVLLVANHSGSLPLDSAMLKLSLAIDHPAHRRLRPLAENFVFHFPFLGVMMNRFGAVRACQENAEALLEQGEAIAVFPEGVKGLGKPFRKRYQLQRFGRGGFIRLALRTRTPIVPVAIVGAEEMNPVIARLVRPGRTLGLPYFPVTPTFPLLGPLGLVPLPTKWTIEFGEPVHLDAEGQSDELTIARLTEDIRSDIQTRLDKLLSQRSGWFG
jgi:1-acyl-sn-glycerol-3-phosphate acyltransferase